MSIENFIKLKAKGTCVYWASPTLQADSSYAYSAGVEISCLWVGSSKLLSSPQGREIYADAMILVTQDLANQGVLYNGVLADLTAGQIANPATLKDAYEIIEFAKRPSLLQGYSRIAYLRKRTVNG